MLLSLGRRRSGIDLNTGRELVAQVTGTCVCARAIRFFCIDDNSVTARLVKSFDAHN